MPAPHSEIATTHLHPMDRAIEKRSKEKVLRFSMKRSRAVAASVAAVGLLSVVAVSSAAAAPAVWSELPAGGVTPATLAGTLTLKLDGGSPVVCPVSPNGALPSLALNATGPQAYYSATSNRACVNGRAFGMSLVSRGESVGGAYSLAFGASAGTSASPYGSDVWAQAAFSAPFTNGAGGVASSVTLSNTVIGVQQNGGTVTASGTLQLTRPGGTLTLN